METPEETIRKHEERLKDKNPLLTYLIAGLFLWMAWELVISDFFKPPKPAVTSYPRSIPRERMEYDPMNDTPEGCAYRYGNWVCEQEIGGSCYCEGADY